MKDSQDKERMPGAGAAVATAGADSTTERF